MFICEHCGKELHYKTPSSNPLKDNISNVYRYFHDLKSKLDINNPLYERREKLYWLFQKFVGEYNQLEYEMAVASLECLTCEMVSI